MQRALSVKTVPIELDCTMSLAVLPSTQVWDLEASDIDDFKRPFWEVIREYQARTPIRITGAEDCINCTVTVDVSGSKPYPE